MVLSVYPGVPAIILAADQYDIENICPALGEESEIGSDVWGSTSCCGSWSTGPWIALGGSEAIFGDLLQF